MAPAAPRAAPGAARALAAAALAARLGAARPILGKAITEAEEPRLPWELLPVEEAFPAFARGGPATHELDGTIPVDLPRVWEVVKDQRTLLNSHIACKQIFNFSGPPGEWLAEVQWWAPRAWHRWTRREVRKYTELDDDLKRLAYFVVGGLGDWLPRLALRETYSADAGNASQTNLHVEVWYEFDEDAIGWPASEDLHSAQKRRWERWYRTNGGYAKTVEELLTPGSLLPRRTDGTGTLQTDEEVRYWLERVLLYDRGGALTPRAEAPHWVYAVETNGYPR